MKIAANSRTTIVGTSGSGKSYFLKKLIKKFIISGHRIIIYDIKYEYAGQHAVDAHYGNTKIYIAHDVKTLEEALEGRDAQLTVVQPTLKEGGTVTNFARCCEYIYSQKDLIFVVDELAHLQTKQSILPALKAIVTQKRAHNVGFVGAAQRFAGIHNDILSQSNNLITFAQHSPSDVKSLRDFVGGLKVPCWHCGNKGCAECKQTGELESEEYAMIVREPFFRLERLYLWYTDSGQLKIMKSPR